MCDPCTSLIVKANILTNVYKLSDSVYPVATMPLHWMIVLKLPTLLTGQFRNALEMRFQQQWKLWNCEFAILTS